jgi:broad specificity phosphatase PhoE
VLVRHGQYEHGDTDDERVLTELGRMQAAEVGNRLGLLYKDGSRLNKVVYSTMARATETALLIKDQLGGAQCKWKTCNLIREGAVYPPEPPHSTWQPTEEAFDRDGARISKAFEKYVHRSEVGENKSSTTLFVCHGNVIRYVALLCMRSGAMNSLRPLVCLAANSRWGTCAHARTHTRAHSHTHTHTHTIKINCRYFVMRALQLPPSAWLRISVANCSMTIISIRSNGNVSVQTVGDAGFMPDKDMITFN